MNYEFARSLGAALLAIAALGACSSMPAPVERPVVRHEEPSPEAALRYYQGLSKLAPGELGRERSILQAVPSSPYTQMRLALLLGHPRVQSDLPKALALLDGILKSSDAATLPYQPLARLLVDTYLERIKLDAQSERQAQGLRESQRKVQELQEKLDGLADIERTLSPRPKTVRPEGVKR